MTGDAGFIGFHLAKRLLARGDFVLGVDGMTEYYDPRLKRDRLAQIGQHDAFSHVTQMLEDRDALVDLLSDFKPDIIVHLAAQAGVRYSIDNPAAYLSSNIDGTFSVLEAAKVAQPTHLLIASTSSVYGGNVKVPFAEIDRTDAPVSLYAATKRAMEALAHSYSSLYTLPTSAFRFFTVYGPWGRPDMALFKFVGAILAGRPIDVYGNGEMSRDFTYIDDLINCIEKLIDHPPIAGVATSKLDSVSAVAPFRTVNIGGGKPVGLLDFISEIEKSLGVEAQKTFLPMQAGDMIETYADPTLLQQLVGEIPSTPLARGVRNFVDWYINYASAVPQTASGRGSHNPSPESA